MLAKSDLRKEAAAKRASLARGVPDYAQRVVAFAKQIPINKTTIVSAYWPMGDEADPRALMAALAQRGATLALPRVVKQSPLVFHEWREGDAMLKSRFGVHEPHLTARVVVPDILLMPLLLFDAMGYRLGYGGGYYDRTLERLRALKPIRAIGVAFAGQEVVKLPREPHDARLDMLVTEQGIRRFG